MSDAVIPASKFFSDRQPEWPVDLRPTIRDHVNASGAKLLVLDDDPTGTQTVHDVPVLTAWTADLLSRELASPEIACFVLTNSRSLSVSAAVALSRQVGANLLEAVRRTGRQVTVVSRSDSTLRGHFPHEVDALAAALGAQFDACLLVPFFLEGGRYTANDIHYVAEGDRIIPVALTPFAADSAFGYRSSHLRAWVAEKTAGRVQAEDVASISLDDLRCGGPGRVAEHLWELRGGRYCVVNALSYRDLEVFVSGLLEAEAAGKCFLCRTASSFVQVRAGLSSRPLLSSADLKLPPAGGALILAGSYIPRTTAQIADLLATGICGVEVKVEALLDPRATQSEIEQAAQKAEGAVAAGNDVLVYTSRRLVATGDAAASLAIGQRISDGLIAILHKISTRPRYLVAKGGITSSDVATRGLGIIRAWVRGQILPGVPVWVAGPESRFPGLTYIVFPGNVGNEHALAEIINILGL